MRKRENGFTYPFTLIVLLLFLTFFSVKVEELLTERKMTHETSIILQQEYYIFSSIKKVEHLYQTGTPIQTKGTILYINGKMEYQPDKPIGNVQIINFTLRLYSGETLIGRGYFETDLKHLTKWVEMN
jgi:hypothetical protein